MIDRKMKKNDPIALSGISRSTAARLTRDENVTTDVLARIRKALHCDIEILWKCPLTKNKVGFIGQYLCDN